jgi:hypothetical protein
MPRSSSRIPLGDSRSLNWRTHVLFAIPALLSAGFFDFDRLGGNPGLWLLLSIIGLAATVGTIELASWVLRKPRWTKPHTVTVLGILLLAGIARGTTLFLAGQAFGIVPATDLTYRLIGGPIFVISIYLLVNLIVASYVQHREQTRILITRRDQLEKAKAGFEKELARLIEAQRSRVRELVAPSVWELQKFLGAQTKNIQDAIFEIRSLNEQIVRPLSIQMASSSSSEDGELLAHESDVSPSRQSWLPRTISLSDSIGLGFFILVAIILGFNSQSAVLGIQDAFSLILATLPVIMVGLWIFVRVLKGVALRAPIAVLLAVGYGGLLGYLAGSVSEILGLTATAQFPVQSSSVCRG